MLFERTLLIFSLLLFCFSFSFLFFSSFSASYMGRSLFMDHYLRDFGDVIEASPDMEEAHDQVINFGSFMLSGPPSIFGYETYNHMYNE